MFQAKQKGGQGQYSQVPAAYPATAAWTGSSQLRRNGGGGPGSTGCRLSVRRDGRTIPAQEAPPPPVFLRNGGGSSDNAPVPHLNPGPLAESWGEALAPLDTMADDAKEGGSAVEGADPADKSPVKPARKPTFLQKARWKAVEKARRKGMSLRAIERELGIHRSTIKKYLDAEGPPTRRSPATPPAPPDAASADTMKT